MRRFGQCRRLALGLALSGTLACAVFTGPSESDVSDAIVLDGWYQAEQHGLTLYTNASEATARRAFRQLNRVVDIVSQFTIGRRFEANGRMEVFVFGTRHEYHRFGPDFAGGHARLNNGEIQIALSIDNVLEGTRTIYHELVHAVLHNEQDRRFPSWFHEGMAVFFSTSILRGDVLTVGALDFEALAEIRTKRPLPLRRLLASPVSGQSDIPGFYADAWAFVHFGLLSPAMNGPDRRDSFWDFVFRVSRGEPWEPAFLAAFKATPEEISVEYERHRARLAKTRVLTLDNITLDLDEPPLEFEPIDRLEIARELADLGLDGRKMGVDSAALLFDELLAFDPGDSISICGRIRVAAVREEIDLAESLLERLGDDERLNMRCRQAGADLALARAKRLGGDETLRAEDLALAIKGYRSVIVEAPDRFWVLMGLGQALILAEDMDPTADLPSIERAVALAPQSAQARLILAQLLIRSDASSAAKPHLDYVLEAYPKSPFAKSAKRLLRKAR